MKIEARMFKAEKFFIFVKNLTVAKERLKIA